jgi:hypothetical protein
MILLSVFYYLLFYHDIAKTFLYKYELQQLYFDMLLLTFSIALPFPCKFLCLGDVAINILDHFSIISCHRTFFTKFMLHFILKLCY